MSVTTRINAQKPSVGVAAIAGAVLFLLIIVGLLWYRNFGPKHYSTGPLPEAKNDWVSKLAKQTGGDINKVDPKLRQKMEIYTGGHAAELLKSKYEAATH